MQNISGFGTSVLIVALQSFPMGFSLSEFSDDVDPLVIEDNESTKIEMLYDGSLFAYDTASPINISVSVIPNSNDDINLRILLSVRKSGIRILPIDDVTSMVITYPDKGKIIFSNGTILSGPPADSILSSGRRKTNTYKFAFGTTANIQNGAAAAATVITGLLSL